MGTTTASLARLTALAVAFCLSGILWQARRARAGLAGKARPPDRAVRAGRAHRCRRPRHGPAAHGGAGPAGDRGQPAGRGRHDRHRRPRQSRRRRLHAVFRDHFHVQHRAQLYSNPGFDPLRSFAPISQLVTAPFLVVVHPSLPARSLQELIKLAKAKPGQLNFGSGGSGTPPHIAGEMFKAAAGVDLLHVPFKGMAAAVIDLVTGRVQVMFEQLLPLQPHLQSGKLQASRGRQRQAPSPASRAADQRRGRAARDTR